MRALKALGLYLAADILCMFINITFAALHNGLFRAVCAVCTAGIMLALVGNYALTAAAADEKAGRKFSGAAADVCGLLAVPAVSWAILLVSMKGGFDFYRWYKVLNGAFLRVINLIEPDASSAAVSTADALAMLPFVLIPAAVYLVVYTVCRKNR